MERTQLVFRELYDRSTTDEWKALQRLANAVLLVWKNICRLER